MFNLNDSILLDPINQFIDNNNFKTASEYFEYILQKYNSTEQELPLECFNLTSCLLKDLQINYDFKTKYKDAILNLTNSIKSDTIVALIQHNTFNYILDDIYTLNYQQGLFQHKHKDTYSTALILSKSNKFIIKNIKDS